MGELLRDGLEVAVPARDRGVDVIAYADLSRQVAAFTARPLQLKAFSTSALILHAVRSETFSSSWDLSVIWDARRSACVVVVPSSTA